ncbi:hypothetical protein MJT46_007532, partial [Ovis ammon polii x Ovis aries]
LLLTRTLSNSLQNVIKRKNIGFTELVRIIINTTHLEKSSEVRQLILEALQQVNLDVRECGQLARSGPVSGFQEDTLQLAFIDLRKDPGE